MFPNFWSIESEAEREKVVHACTTATASTKVAKVFIVRDNVWATIELFCSPPEHFMSVFDRSMGALMTGVANFVEEMRK